jgi:ribosomal-protein-alanine N-acetyltransferase
MKKTPTLVSERLVLRPFAEGDGPSIYKWCSSSKVTQFLFWYPHKDEMVSERLLKVWLRKKRHYSWGITLGNDLFGEVEVIKDIQDNECEIGYTLREDMWGKGYAKEALRKVICFLFVSEGYKSINAETDARNERSGFLLYSLGFNKTGENVPFYVSKKDEHIFLNQYLLFPHDFVASLPVNDENFEKVTKEEIRIHPNLEAVDLIKLAYQNAYGGEHLIEDEEKAKEYLQEELSKVKQEKGPLFEDIGGGLVRLELAASLEKGLTEENIFRLFIDSDSPRLEAKEKLINNFETIKNVLKDEPIKNVNEKTFKEALTVYKEGPVHHSETYRKLYSPHYRLVSLSYLLEFLPLPSYQ